MEIDFEEQTKSSPDLATDIPNKPHAEPHDEMSIIPRMCIDCWAEIDGACCAKIRLVSCIAASRKCPCEEEQERTRLMLKVWDSIGYEPFFIGELTHVI